MNLVRPWAQQLRKETHEILHPLAALLWGSAEISVTSKHQRWRPMVLAMHPVHKRQVSCVMNPMKRVIKEL